MKQLTYASDGPWVLTSDGIKRIGVNYFGFKRIVNEPKINSPFNYYLSRKINTVTLATQVNVGDATVTLEPGHGVQVGEAIEFSQETGLPHPLDAVRLYQSEVKSVAGDVIGVVTPVDFPFGTSAAGYRSDINVNIDASVTPATFTFAPIAGLDYYIRSMVVTLTHAGAAGLSTFGDIIGGLPNGLYFEKVSPGLFNFIALTARSNQDFAERSDQLTFMDKQAGTRYGTVWRYSISSPEMAGTSVFVNSQGGDSLRLVIRDDLTQLTSMRVNIVGVAINAVETAVV